MEPNYDQMVRGLFEAFQRIQFGDKRGVLPGFGNMQKKIFDLSAARENEELRVEGDFVFADKNSTGTLDLKYNSGAMPGFPFSASTGVKGFPYRTLLISNAAQTGKQVVLWYGFGAEIIPPNQDIANIGSITNPVSLENSYGSAFASNTALGGATNETVIAPASNTAGVSIAQAQAAAVPGGTGGNAAIESLLAKTSAPTSSIDGDLLMMAPLGFTHTAVAGVISPSGNLLVPLIVASGKGLYFRNSGGTAEILGLRSLLYTL